jgi:hypothetical protein
MTREQAEKKIRDKFVEILKIYKEYEPEGEYLTLHYIEDCISFNNRYWESEKKIHYFESFEKE